MSRKFIWSLRGAVAGAAAATLLAGSPGFAQTLKPGPTQQAADASGAFSDGAAYCLNAVDDLEAAEATLVDLGWQSEGVYDVSPFSRNVSISKIADPLGDLYYYAAVEQYETTYLVYCTYEIQGEISGIDLAAAAEEFGLTGSVEQGQDGVHGSWELFLDEEVIFVQAEVFEDYFYMQVTWIGNQPGAVTGPK